MTKFYGSNQNEVDRLVKIVKIAAKDIGRKVAIDKCSVLAMKSAKEVECSRIETENGEEIDQIGEKRYKYLSGDMSGKCFKANYL